MRCLYGIDRWTTETVLYHTSWGNCGEADTDPISYGHAGPSLSYFAEYLVALEIGLPLRIWLTQRASTLGDLRPMREQSLLATTPPLCPETAIVIEC